MTLKDQRLVLGRGRGSNPKEKVSRWAWTREDMSNYTKYDI